MNYSSPKLKLTYNIVPLVYSKISGIPNVNNFNVYNPLSNYSNSISKKLYKNHLTL